ncbi:MAG: ABC transporter ATP-binding protein [Dermatophilaceae bacterium]
MVNNDLAIEAVGLRVIRGGKVVLHDLTVSIPASSVVGLLGPSGGGKSTFIRSVVGVQRIAGGEIRVFGEPAGSPSLRHRVGYVTQTPSVYADLTVHDNVAYFGAVCAAPSSATAEAIAAVDLTDQSDQRVGTLSGGQLSRVSLAAALVASPDLLVLDEPTVGLDPVLRRDLWDLFHRLAAGGTSLLVSSHVMDEATRCNRLLLIRDGRIIADTTPTDLLETTGAADAEGAFLRLIESQGAVA